MKILLNLFIFLLLPLFKNEPTPPEYFGSSWDDAITFCIQNKNQFAQSFSKYSIEPDIAFAVVFPEIVRYNRYRDFIETSVLEYAYKRGGKEYADFSIGPFQMKPSFIEMLEDILNHSDTVLKAKYPEVIRYDQHNPNLIREERLTRLQNLDWQLTYLSCFLDIAIKKYSLDTSKDPLSSIIIISSAYNHGFEEDINKLVALSKLKTFPYGKYAPGRFSYSDISIYFYKYHTNNIINESAYEKVTL